MAVGQVDHRKNLEESIKFYVRKKIFHPKTWERLWDDIWKSYQVGDISDNEYEDLLNRYTAYRR